MTTTDTLLSNSRLWAIVERCGWFDIHWQFDNAVDRCCTTPERFAARLLDCERFDNPAAVAIAGMVRHGYGPTDRSLQVIAEMLKPPALEQNMAVRMAAMFLSPFTRMAKTADELLADKLLKAHRQRLEDAGIYSAEALVASEMWEEMK